MPTCHSPRRPEYLEEGLEEPDAPATASPDTAKAGQSWLRKSAGTEFSNDTSTPACHTARVVQLGSFTESKTAHTEPRKARWPSNSIRLEDLADMGMPSRSMRLEDLADMETSHARFRDLLSELECEYERLRAIAYPTVGADVTRANMPFCSGDLHGEAYLDCQDNSSIELMSPKKTLAENPVGNGDSMDSIGSPSTESILHIAENMDSLEVDSVNDLILERWRNVVQILFKGADNCVVREAWGAHQSLRIDSRTRTGELDKFRSIENNRLRSHSGWLTRRRSLDRNSAAWGSRWWGRGCVSQPYARSRRLWIVLALLMIAWEFFSITMSPFSFFSSGFTNKMEWTSVCFWILDIYITFTSGIYIQGRVELACYAVAKNYITSWFFFDFALVGIQIAALLSQDDTLGAVGVLKLTRVTRSLRLSKQFIRLKEAFGLSDFGNTLFFGKIAACNMGLYVFVHCNACLFYEIGSEANNGWVTRNKAWLSDSPFHNYLVALHWSLSQMQGSVDIYPSPDSTFDRLFCVISSCASIVVLALVVSMMTDTLVSVRQQRKRKADEDRYVRIFFRTHDIRPEIRARAEHHLFLRERQQDACQDNELNLRVLRMFPTQFRTLLLAEIQGYQLTWHPIFAYLDHFHRPVFIKACSSIINLHSYEPHDDAFTAGSVSDHAYIILKGEFVLNVMVDVGAALSPWLVQCRLGSANFDEPRENQTSVFESALSLPGKAIAKKAKPFQRLEKGQLVCEVSLWMCWTHVSSLCSVDHGQCNNLSSRDLISILEQHPHAHATFSYYACRFARVATSLRETDNGEHGDQKIELMTFHTVVEIERTLSGRDDSDYARAGSGVSK